MNALVLAAQRTVPGFDHVGISIARRSGEIETKAGTDALVWELDEVQYALGEGPCLDALHTDHVVLVEHARHAQRWPRYIPAAVKAGVRSQLAMRLYRDDQTIGGLNLYSTQAGTIDDDAAPIAESVRRPRFDRARAPPGTATTSTRP